MKTWEQTKEEFIKLHTKKGGQNGNNTYLTISTKELLSFFETNYKQILEEIVPKEKDRSECKCNAWGCDTDGWNWCRQEMLDKINEFFNEKK